MRSWTHYIFMTLTLLLVAGCGGGSDRPTTYPVGGKITLNGDPVADAHVVFQPTDTTKGVAARGRTDSEGNYVLTTFDTGDGAVPGEYKIVISKSSNQQADTEIDLDDPSGEYGEMMNEAAKNEGEVESQLPEIYASAASTPETRLVAEGDNEFNFQLQN